MRARTVTPALVGYRSFQRIPTRARRLAGSVALSGRPMSRRFAGQRNQPDSALAAWSRLSAATLRPSAACGLAEAPVRGACASSGQQAWPRQPAAARATRDRDGAAAARRWQRSQRRCGRWSMCAKELTRSDVRSKGERGAIAAVPKIAQCHSALTRWASSSCADRRRRLSWPSCHACRAIVCRLSCTYS